MQPQKLVLDFVHDLDRTTAVSDAGASFQKLIGEFGFHYYFMGGFTPGNEKLGRGRVWAHSRHRWLQQWWEINGGHEDPVLNRLRHDHSPLRWSSLREKKDTPNIELLDCAAEFGLRDGWSLAFNSGRTNALPIAIGLGTDRYALGTEHETALHLAMIYFGLKLSRLEQMEPALVRLSERERECLCWVAAGRSDSDISEILMISQQTVHKHVSNALKKLNAGTRAHAVAIALSRSQIKL